MISIDTKVTVLVVEVRAAIGGFLVFSVLIQLCLVYGPTVMSDERLFLTNFLMSAALH